MLKQLYDVKKYEGLKESMGGGRTTLHRFQGVYDNGYGEFFPYEAFVIVSGDAVRVLRFECLGCEPRDRTLACMIEAAEQVAWADHVSGGGASV
jgi:hypothetical protein